MCVLANLGVRPGEALEIRAADLRIVGERAGTVSSTPWVRIRRLKKRTALGAIDDLPLSRPLAVTLVRYVGSTPVGFAPDDRLFPLTVRQAERMFHYYAKAAGLGGRFRLYALRHTAATRALEASGDLRAVQVMLGHSRITTTQVYAHVPPRRRQELAERVGNIV